MAEAFPEEVGDYRLLNRIAVGGMAEIFRAEPISGGEPLVLKRLLPHLREQKIYVERFVGEAKLCVKLRHPNVVRTVKLFRKESDYYIVQELVDGLSLLGLLKSRHRLGFALPLSACFQIGAGVLSALEYIHRSKLGDTAVTIVHRDVSPANILINLRGVVKLTDFGVAEASLHPELKAEEGTLTGTPAYMSPEQVMGTALDPRSDIFSVGSVLYECLANRPPFASDVEYDLLKQVRDAQPPLLELEGVGAEPLRALLGKAMAPKPDNRYATAGDFRKALLAVCKELGQPPSEETLAETVAAALEPET